MPSLSDLASDRRRLLVAVTGGVVAVAIVAVALTMVLGGGGSDEDGAGKILPLELTALPDQSGVIGVDGQPAQLTQAELDAVVATLLAYLREATVTPLYLEKPDEDETTTTLAGAPSLESFFTDTAVGRLQTEDRLTLSDEHLPFAKDGVSTSKATVALTGIVQDGAAQFVNATIDVVMLVKGDDEITVMRSGDLVLRSVDGTWKIAAYKLSVTRAFGDRTTTSEAAFG